MRQEYIYVGSWLDGKSKNNGGIHQFCFFEKEERLEHIASFLPGLSAGYMAFSPDNRFLYAVHEVKGGTDTDKYSAELYAFSVDPVTGRLELIDNVPTNGVFANYVALDSTGKYAFVGNYGSEDTVVRAVRDENGDYRLERIYDEGSVAVFRICENGTIGGICDLVKHTDKPSRRYPRLQSSPHPHSVNISPDDKYVLVTDQGCDLLVLYRFNRINEKLERVFDHPIDNGLGPRNSAFHPTRPYFFVLHELYPYISSFGIDQDTGKITEICTLPIVPREEIKDDLKDFLSMAHPADIRIHPNGELLSVSVRGRDAIALYKIDVSTGRLRQLQLTYSGGNCPRTCSWDREGRHLFVGNQNSGRVKVMKFSEERSILEPSKAVAYVERPVCIKVWNPNSRKQQ